MRKFWLIIVVCQLCLFLSCGGGSSTSSSSSTPPPSGGGQSGLKSIQITPAAPAIAPGTTQAFTATGSYTDGSTKDLTLNVQWACPGSTLATISNTSPTQGYLTAVSAGSVVVTATMSGVTASANLTVKNVINTGLVLAPAAAPVVGWGNQQQFTATATFSDQTTQDVTNAASWSATSPFVTTNSGLLIGQALGENTVSASFGSESAQAKLTVNIANLVSLSVSPASPTIANHTNLQLAALGTFVDGSVRDVSSLAAWSSSNTSVAKFSSLTNLSQITSSSVGTTIVTATVGSITGSTTLTVSSATLQSVSLVPANASLAVGNKLAMSAIGGFSDGSTQDISDNVGWNVSDTTLATIDSGGNVTPASGASPGPVTVTATSYTTLGSVPGTTQVTISTATLSTIAVTPATVLTSPGSTQTFDAVGTYSDGSTEDVSQAAGWSSNLNNVVSVHSGVGTAEGIGQAIISAKLGAIKGTAQMTVAPPQQISLAIQPSSVQVAQQTSVQLDAQGTITGGTAQDVTTAVNWASSAPNIATIGLQTGIINAIAPGQATITATLGTVSVSAKVTVTNASLNSITVSPQNPSLTLGSSQFLTATGHFGDGSTETLVGVTWISSVPTVAVVNNAGFVNSTGAGVAKITAAANGVSGSTDVTVK